MSLLDKKMYIYNFEEKIKNLFSEKEIYKLREELTDLLSDYDINYTHSDNDIYNDSNNLIKLFLNAKEIEGRSRQTLSHYEYVLNRLMKETNTPLSKITINHLRSWLMKEKERGISLRTLEGNRYVFTSFFGWCWKEELIQKNPTLNLSPIKQQKIIRKPYSSIEMEKLKESVTNTRDLAIIEFLFSTGCRISEVCALNIADIDLRSRSVKVLGKGNKERIVYLDDVCVMYLERYFKERNDNKEALFLGKTTDRLTPHGVRAMLKRLEVRSGVENVHPHRFRRTLATNLINHGMPIQEVAAILGHDKIDTTMKYVYINQTNVENAYRRYL